jgi:hypothetical protein
VNFEDVNLDVALSGHPLVADGALVGVKVTDIGVIIVLVFVIIVAVLVSGR